MGRGVPRCISHEAGWWLFMFCPKQYSDDAMKNKEGLMSGRVWVGRGGSAERKLHPTKIIMI